MTRKKALERWETKIGNTEITPQAIWHITNSLLKRDGPRAPTAIHGPSGLIFHASEKANAIADCFENQLTHHDLCDGNHERWVEARVQALLETVDNKPPERTRPCDLQKLINSLKLRKSCGIDGIPNECLRHLPRRPLVHLSHLLNQFSTAAVFLDIETAFDTTWHSGLLYILSKLEFSTSLFKLIGSFLSQRKFRVSVEGESQRQE
jgi:hypothetical protein